MGYAMLSTTPSFDVALMFQIISRLGMQHVARFSPEQWHYLVAGEGCPPAPPATPQQPRFLGTCDSFPILATRKDYKVYPEEYLPEFNVHGVSITAVWGAASGELIMDLVEKLKDMTLDVKFQGMEVPLLPHDLRSPHTLFE